MLAFFPWLKLNEPLKIESYQLLPYIRGKAPSIDDLSLQQLLDDVLEGYRITAETPINQATILQFDNEIVSDIDEQRQNDLFMFAELLSVAGLSCRKFFQGGGANYWNRDHFRLILQNLPDKQYKGTAIVTRRRDGRTLNGVSKKAFLKIQPAHISSLSTKIDKGLLESLLKAQDKDIWSQIIESIVYFNMTNTDSSDSLEQSEAVFLIGAFERLLGCKSGNEKDLVEKFVSSIILSEELPPEYCQLCEKSDERVKNAKSLRELWIKDYFRSRGHWAHGKVELKYPAIWSMKNHLLLGSYLFPLLLKSYLSKQSLYTLTDNDQEAIELFEELASIDHFTEEAKDPNRPPKYPWNTVFSKTNNRRLAKILHKSYS